MIWKIWSILFRIKFSFRKWCHSYSQNSALLCIWKCMASPEFGCLHNQLYCKISLFLLRSSYMHKICIWSKHHLTWLTEVPPLSENLVVSEKFQASLALRQPQSSCMISHRECSPVWLKGIVLSSEHYPYIGGVIYGRVEISVVTNRGRKVHGDGTLCHKGPEQKKI